MMSFFLSPFIFVFELIGFLISAAFVYGLTLIAAITILWYGISTMPSATTEYVYINEVVETVKEMPGLVCNQISGCRIWWDKNGVEFCPTCVGGKDTTSKTDGVDFPPIESKTW